MQGFTRFGGTMELSGINHKINIKRVQSIAKQLQLIIHVVHSQTTLDDVKCGLTTTFS